MYPPNIPAPINNDIERVAAVATHFRPRATHPSTEYIERERSLLDIDLSIRIRIQLWLHERLLPVIAVTAVNPR